MSKNAMTVQEIAERIRRLRAADSPFVERGEWDDLMELLGDVFQVPDDLLYVERTAPAPDEL